MRQNGDARARTPRQEQADERTIHHPAGIHGRRGRGGGGADGKDGFHAAIVSKDASSPTVKPSIQANLAVMLGREACLRGSRVTWDEMIKESRRIEPDLRGLKA